jgi:hypothetical protein
LSNETYKDGDVLVGTEEGPIIKGVEGGTSGTVRGLSISSAGAGAVEITNETIEQTEGDAANTLGLAIGGVSSAGTFYRAGVSENGEVHVAYMNKLVPEQYDQISLAYDGATLTSVVYVNSAATVATLTLAYDGANLTSVVKT